MELTGVFGFQTALFFSLVTICLQVTTFYYGYASLGSALSAGQRPLLL